MDISDLTASLAGKTWQKRTTGSACANICEHCPNFRTDTGYLPMLAAQKADAEPGGSLAATVR